MQAWEKNHKMWSQSPREIRHWLQIGFIRILEKPMEISFYLILHKMITVICGTLIPARNKIMFYRDVSTEKPKQPWHKPLLSILIPQNHPLSCGTMHFS